jgi:glycosyltransferase involved in cell wall biosynthesis
MKSKKSILMLSNLTGQMGKGQSVCETLAQLLAGRGWRVYAASMKASKVLRITDMVINAWRYRSRYAVGYIEVYSGLGFVWAEVVAALLRFLNKPFVLALYGGDLPVFSANNPVRVKRLLNSADTVISPSAYTQNLMRPYCSNIRVLSYGVNFNDFRFRLRSQPSPKLMTMRAFHSIYNLNMAPKVLIHLMHEFPHIELLMTGGNKHDGSWELVKETAEIGGVTNRVKMLGFVPRANLPEVLDQSDIVLNTPNIDNTPVSLLEAMACGLCIVSTKVGGIPYLLDHEQNALLVPPDDTLAMAAAVRRILVEPGLAQRLSQNARKKAEQFDWSVVLPRWERLFLEAAHA